MTSDVIAQSYPHKEKTPLAGGVQDRNTNPYEGERSSMSMTQGTPERQDLLNTGSDLMTFEEVADAYPQLWVSYLFRMGYTHGPGDTWLWTRSIIDAWVAQNGIEA